MYHLDEHSTSSKWAKSEEHSLASQGEESLFT